MKRAQKSKHDGISCSERDRKHRSPYMTCTSIPDDNLRGRTCKQKHGDQPDQKLEVYQEKYLSKKIMTFQWSTSETHMPEKSDLLQTICHRIKNNVSPDVTIRIKDKKFECHSIVLLCYMDLSEEMKCTRKEIALNENKISYETFVEIYHWMLTESDKSHMKLTRGNVLQILEAAKYLGVEELENQCWAFINSEEIFNEATAFFLYLNAKNSLPEESREPIMQLMLPRIQKFFLILVSSRNWIELDVKDACALLSSNYTRVRCELEIFMSAVRWLQADWNTRKQHVVQVMQCVRFGLMSPFHLVQIRQSSEFTQMTTLPGVQKLITEGMDVATVKSTHALVTNKEKQVSQMFGLKVPLPRHYLKHDDYLYDRLSCIYRDFLSQLNKIKEGKIPLNDDDDDATSVDEKSARNKSPSVVPRRDNAFIKVKEMPLEEQKTEKIIQIVTDNSDETPGVRNHFMELSSRNVKKINDSKRKQEISTSPPCSVARNILDRAESAIFMEESEAVLVFGGVDKRASFSRQKETGREIHRYNPFVNTWQLVDKMPAARQYHSTVYHDGLVYIAGGIDLSRGENNAELVSNSVWSFNPTNKQWTHEADMIHPRKNFNLVACRDKLYAIGGLNGRDVLTSVECYDPVGRIWHEVAPFKEARMGLAAAEVGDKIWIAGGHNGHALNPLSDKVECYDPGSNTWSTLTPKLRYPRYMATLVCVSNEKIYLIGGAAQTDSSNVDKMYSVSDLDVLDLAEKKEWRSVSELAHPRHGHTASILSTQILIIGGVTTVYKKPVKSVECWCFKRQAWIKGVSGLLEPIVGHSSVVLPSKT